MNIHCNTSRHRVTQPNATKRFAIQSFMHMSVLVDVTARPRPPPLRTSNKPRLVPRDTRKRRSCFPKDRGRHTCEGARRKNSGSAEDTIYTFTTLELLQKRKIITIQRCCALSRYTTLNLLQARVESGTDCGNSCPTRPPNVLNRT